MRATARARARRDRPGGATARRRRRGEIVEIVEIVESRIVEVGESAKSADAARDAIRDSASASYDPTARDRATTTRCARETVGQGDREGGDERRVRALRWSGSRTNWCA